MSQEQNNVEAAEQAADGQVQRASQAPPPARRKPMSQVPVKRGVGADLQTMEDVSTWASFVVQAGLNPPGLPTQQAVALATFKGYELGITPTEALTNIAVINNRPCAWGDLPLRLCYGSGFVENFEEWIDGEGDAMAAHCRVKRKGMDAPVERTFSLQEAKDAGLYPGTDRYGKPSPRSPWNKYPKRMLQMRARGFALRDAFPDALSGIGIAEEERDIAEHQGFDPTQSRAYQDADTDPLLEGAQPNGNHADPEQETQE